MYQKMHRIVCEKQMQRSNSIDILRCNSVSSLLWENGCDQTLNKKKTWAAVQCRFTKQKGYRDQKGISNQTSEIYGDIEAVQSSYCGVKSRQTYGVDNQ